MDDDLNDTPSWLTEQETSVPEAQVPHSMTYSPPKPPTDPAENLEAPPPAMEMPDAPAVDPPPPTVDNPNIPTWALSPSEPVPTMIQTHANTIAHQHVASTVGNFKSGLDGEVTIPTKIKNAISVSHIMAAFFLGLASVLSLMGNVEVQTAIVCLYLFAFGTLICGFEMGYGLKTIAAAIDGNCGFIRHAVGRCAFLMLVGMLASALGVWGIVATVICFIAAAINVYAAFNYQKLCAAGGKPSTYAGPGSTG